MSDGGIFSSEPFTLNFNIDGVYLVISGKTLDKVRLLNQIIQKLTASKVTGFDRNIIAQAIESSDGRPVKISNMQVSQQINSTITVKISTDKMKASVLLTPPVNGGRPSSSSEILEQLKQKGVTYGIDYEGISRLTSNPKYNENIDVAFGLKPIKGDDGKVDLRFSVNLEKKPTILEDGSVDFRELNYINSVKKGQVLAKIIPPKDGVEGRNVNGAIIQFQRGKPARNPRGKNTDVINNVDVIAQVDGYVSYMDEKINVMDILEIPGNVDISTGNIRFSGNVIVRGNVLTDFVIEASGNVEVHGVVEGAIIKADGDIILKRGIQGLNKARLESGQDILARFIEHCTVIAANNIKTESIMHCNVNCGNSIELVGRKGLIVGGNIKVGKDIIAVSIGSQMSTPTNIEVGIDPTKREKFREAKERFTSCLNELNNTRKSIGVLKSMESKNMLTPDKRMLLGKLIAKETELSNEFTDLQEQLEELEGMLEDVKNSRIKVRGTIYSGVKLTIGTASKYIKDSQQFAVFYLDGAEIKALPFE